MMKYLLILFIISFGLNTQAQDTLAVRSIEKAIAEAENGNFVSLGLIKDTSSVFPPDFFSIPKDQLIGLVIDNCNYETLPESIKDYRNLTYFRYSWFYFSDCPLQRFPDFIPETSSLEFVTIEGAVLKSVPALEKLTSLKELSLYMCKLPEFPTSVLALSNLEELNLSCNSFTTIPDNINELSNLKSLEFEGGACGGTPISHIPETIGDLKLLEEFSLGYTKTPLKTLPNSFYNLERLEYFECHGCGLESISKDIEKLKNLRSLKLTNLSFFRKFPEELFELTNLERFFFYVYGDTEKELKYQRSQLDKWGATLEFYDFEINVKK